MKKFNEYLNEAKNPADEGEYDYEGDMAKQQLRSMIITLKRMLGMLEDGTNLPEWLQGKITLAHDYVITAGSYLEAEDEEGDLDEGVSDHWKNDTLSGTYRLKGGNTAKVTKHEKPGKWNIHFSDGINNEVGPHDTRTVKAWFKNDVKENLELDELSNVTLQRYKTGANKDMNAGHKTEKRSKGYAQASKKLTDRVIDGLKQKNEDVDLSEADGIKGWKNAASDISKWRAGQGKNVKLVSLKKDGAESKMSDATKMFRSEDEAHAHHKRVTELNPKLKIRHNLYVDGKHVKTLGESVEQIDEISDKLKARYLDKAVQQRYDFFTKPFDPKADPKWTTPKGKPKKGYYDQPHKVKAREKDNRRGEIIDKTAEKLTGKPHYGFTNANASDWWKGKKYTKESAQLDEIQIGWSHKTQRHHTIKHPDGSTWGVYDHRTYGTKGYEIRKIKDKDGSVVKASDSRKAEHAKGYMSGMGNPTEKAKEWAQKHNGTLK